MLFRPLLEQFLPGLPKVRRVLSLNVLVKWVFDFGLTKVWKSPCDHNEQNDTHREYVSTFTPVVLLLEDFRGLILPSAHLRVMYAKTVFALFVGREAKICKLKIIF